MSFFFFFKMLGDLSLMFAFANSVLLIFGCNISSFLPLIVLSLSGTLGYYLNQKSPKLRYLAIVTMLPALYHPENFISLLALLAACLYVGLHIVLRRFEMSHDERVNLFQLGCKLLPFCIAPRLIMITPDTPAPAFFPYLLIFAASTLLLTQTLRHNPAILKQRRFRIMCLGILGGILLVTALFSSPWFLSLVTSLINMIYRCLIAPILLLLSYAVGLVFWVIIKLYPKSALHPEAAVEMWEKLALGADSNILGLENSSEPQDQTFLMVLGTVIALLVAAFLIYFFVSRLKRRKGKRGGASVRETRSSVNQSRPFASDTPLDLVEPRDSRAAVRYYYRKFLRCCKQAGICLSPEMNSSIIEKKARQTFSPESSGWIQNIRSIYIRARYSSHEVNKETVQQMKQDVHNLQNETNNILKRL